MKKIVERILGRADSPRGAAARNIAENEYATRPCASPGKRIYCVGDIHGRLDLLEELHGMIERDAEGYGEEKVLVYLGDYIDRGAQSKQVLDLLIERPLPDFQVVTLLGNHEQAMLDFLKNPQAAAAWLNFGGQVTLLSYGVGLGRIQRVQQVEYMRDELEARLPPAHLDFLEACRRVHVDGSYCFVHAGVKPGIAIEEQVPEDLLWIREEFTRSRADHGYVVVHGHTISGEVEWRPNRIGIDTGAYASGLLTALVLEGEEQRLLQTGRSA